MRLSALLLWLVLAVAGSSQAQIVQNPCAANASGCGVTATDSPTSRPLAARAADVVNIKDYGAVCDGSTDDSAAINAALAVVRTRTYSTAYMWSEVKIPQGVCVITSTINATNLVGKSVTINGAGSVIVCKVNSAPCIDALGSRWIKWRDVTIQGDDSTTQTIGIQIGRTNTTALNSSDNNSFDNVFVFGKYSLTSFYNFSSETVYFSHSYFWNNSTSGSSYALIQDGYNHFGVGSAFVTQNAPADTAQSFNENLFVNCDFRAYGNGRGIWMGNTSRHKFISSYLAVTSANVGVVLYGIGSSNNDNLDFDLHMEAATLTDNFLISGSNTTPIINGIRYVDHLNFATDYVFRADAGIAAVTLRAINVVNTAYNTGSVLMFDNPTIWTVSGEYTSQNLSYFNAPLFWAGVMKIGATYQPAYYGASANFQLQISDSTAVGGNSRGTGAVDLTIQRTAASQVASGQRSFNAGYANEASGYGSVALGTVLRATGTASIAIGEDSYSSGTYSYVQGSKALDRGRYGVRCAASGYFSAQGDAQICSFVLRGSGSSASAIRLTGSNTAAGTTNTINLANNSKFSTTHEVLIVNSTISEYAVCRLTGAGIRRGANAAATAIAATTFPTWVMTSASNATAAGWSCPTMTADTTNGGVNISWTPPGANTDTFYLTDHVDVVEIVK